jgi:hypothetical protein
LPAPAAPASARTRAFPRTRGIFAIVKRAPISSAAMSSTCAPLPRFAATSVNVRATNASDAPLRRKRDASSFSTGSRGATRGAPLTSTSGGVVALARFVTASVMPPSVVGSWRITTASSPCR